jgi:hypothetical protein
MFTRPSSPGGPGTRGSETSAADSRALSELGLGLGLVCCSGLVVTSAIVPTLVCLRLCFLGAAGRPLAMTGGGVSKWLTELTIRVWS